MVGPQCTLNGLEGRRGASDRRRRGRHLHRPRALGRRARRGPEPSTASRAHCPSRTAGRRVLSPCSPMTGTERVLHRYLPAAALFVALIVAWQLAVTVFRLREYLLPAPLSVVRAMMGDEIPWLRHLWITSIEIVGAFMVAGVVGVALGIAVAWSPILSRALVPFLVFVNTLTQVDEELLDLGRVFNAPKWKVFATIRIPNAYPYILSALKVTATAAVVGVIVGEFVASQQGLGYVIITTQGSMNTPVAFAALVWISVVGLAVYGLVVLAARRIAPWAETAE